MKFIRRFGEAFLRKRHSRGFGVHSPYAYRFVKDVIRPGIYGYYAYDFIDDLPEISPRVSRHARWLVRMMIFLGKKRVIAFPVSSESLEIAAASLNINLITSGLNDNIIFTSDDLLVITAHSGGCSLITEAIQGGSAVFAMDPDSKMRMQLTTPIQKGLLFKSERCLLLIPRKEMEYVAYDIEF